MNELIRRALAIAVAVLTDKPVSPKPWKPTVESIVANAQATIDEGRRHIAAQAGDADAMDTKTAALITIASGAFALLVTHTNLADLNLYQGVAAGVALAYFVLGVACCVQAIRPRKDFTYGAYPSFLAALVPDYPHWSVMQQLAVTIGEAREKNVAFLGIKQGWYERAIVTAPFIALGVTAMAFTGALT
jgi:hypothetical protein